MVHHLIERRMQHAQVDINITNLVLGTVMCFWTCFKYVVLDVKVVMCSQNIYVLVWSYFVTNDANMC